MALNSKVSLTPEQIKETQTTYNKYYLAYSKDVEWDPVIINKIDKNLVSPFISRLPVHSETSKIAFLGCGTGRNIQLVKGYGDFECVGYDLSKNMISEAKRKVPYSELHIADITKFDLPEDTFQGVFCESVLSYVSSLDVPKVINNVYNSLVVGGTAIFGFKVNGNLVHPDIYLGHTRYYISYTKKQIDSLFNETAFSIIDTILSSDPFRKDVHWYDLFVRK